MTSKRGPTAGSPFFNQRADADTPSTLRSIEVAAEIAPDTEVQLAPVYYEPQPLVSTSDHKTIEIETIKLADDIDPRKLPTELRLARPVAAAPPDSGWPQTDVVVVSSQPPLAPRRRWRAPLALLVLLGALALLLILRSVARRSPSTAPAEVSAAPSYVAPAGPTSANAVVPAPSTSAVDTALPASAPDAPTSAELAPAPLAPKEQRHINPRNGARPSNVDPAPGAGNGTLATPSSDKPKRAIY
ncbi:MAG TPA: hypothetical protein VK745_20920 [Polyangiaceae bacterium]|jgi:hypothetical protein|nr:hypothetical protein [Polyangiaceae bacterium]